MLGNGLSLGVVARRTRGGGAPPSPPPPSAWTPLALGAQLAGWWDPSDPASVVRNGGAVAELTDRSGQGRHLVQPNAALQPALGGGDAAWNGRAAIVFTGHRLQALSGWWSTSSYALVLVGAFPVDSDLVGSGAVATAGDVLLMRFSGKLRGHHWTAPGAIDGTSVPDASPHVVAQHRAGSSLTLWLDGAQEASSSAASGASPSRQLILGGRSLSATATLSCGEVVLAAAIDATDRARIEGYLAWRWGLEAKLAAAHPFRTAPP
jgi:hypothetical protein